MSCQGLPMCWSDEDLKCMRLLRKSTYRPSVAYVTTCPRVNVHKNDETNNNDTLKVIVEDSEDIYCSIEQRSHERNEGRLFFTM